jgi:hypothetical protein
VTVDQILILAAGICAVIELLEPRDGRFVAVGLLLLAIALLL